MPDAITQRIEEIFSDALEIENPVARTAFLQHACENDPALLAKVEKRLAAYPVVESFFEQMRPSATRDADLVRLLASSAENLPVESDLDEMVGTRTGPYKLLQKIGPPTEGLEVVRDQHRQNLKL